MILVIAGAYLSLVLHTAAGLGTNGNPAPGAWNLPRPSIRIVADQPQAAPGAGHGYLIDKHVAAGVACNACHTTTTAHPASMAACRNCHGGTYGKLAAMSATDSPNPHQSHQGEVPCTACHHVHMAPENYCSQCHAEFDLKVP
jgi:hypothetical protein